MPYGRMIDMINCRNIERGLAVPVEPYDFDKVINMK